MVMIKISKNTFRACLSASVNVNAGHYVKQGRAKRIF